MPIPHAPEPLCPFCGEDKPIKIERWRSQLCCQTCGNHWSMNLPKVDVSGNAMDAEG